MSIPWASRPPVTYTELKASPSCAALHASSSAAVPNVGCPLDQSKHQQRHASFLFKCIDKSDKADKASNSSASSSEIVLFPPCKETVAQGNQGSASVHTVEGPTESVFLDAPGTHFAPLVVGPTESVAAEAQGTSHVRNVVPSVFGSELFGCEFGFQVVSEDASYASGAKNNHALDETAFDEFVFCSVADDDTTFMLRPSFVEDMSSKGELSQAVSSAGRAVATVVGSAASAAGNATNMLLNVILPKRAEEPLEDVTDAEQAEIPNEQEFTAAQSLDEAESPVMPHRLAIRNTFIHIADTEYEKEKARKCLSSSAPCILMCKQFHTKYPAMEKAHMRGECRPCAYFYCKGDGCRLGNDCRFCHLCPHGAFKKKKKEKVKALREQEWLAKQDKKMRKCTSPSETHSNIT